MRVSSKLIERGEETAGVIFAKKSGMCGIEAFAGLENTLMTTEVGEQTYCSGRELSGNSRFDSDHVKWAEARGFGGC